MITSRNIWINFLVGYLSVFVPLLVSAAEIIGEVKEVAGEKITIRIEGTLAPQVGDPLTVTLEHPDMGKMEVGMWTVTKVNFPTVIATLQDATGEAQPLMSVQIASENPIDVSTKVEATEKIMHPNTKFGDLEKRILEGAQSNDSLGVREGIGDGGDVNAADKRSAFPLALAAREGHIKIVDLLLEAGANPNLESWKGGQTSLKLAAAKGHNDVIKRLLEGGAVLDHRGEKYDNEFSGTTALFLAASRGHSKTVKLLLERGADPYVENSQGWIALAYASQDGRIDVINSFLEAGVSLDYVSSTGITPLMTATTTAGNWKAMAYLLGGGANVNAQIPQIPKGKDLDPQLVGMTPLMMAVIEHDDRAFFLLLQAGADPSIKNAAGHTAVDLVAEQIKKNKDKKNVIKNLREMQRALSDSIWGKKRAKAVIEEYLEESVDDNNILVVSALLNMGADPNMYSGNEPLLLQAVDEGSFPIVKLLIDHGATPNAVDDKGISPFLEAAGGKHASEEMARYMLEHGADPHYVPPGAPFTLLHALAMRGAAGLIPDVVNAGVDINAPDGKGGKTALHFAASKGRLEAFKALIAAGADPSLRNNDDETALDLVPSKDRNQYNAALP